MKMISYELYRFIEVFWLGRVSGDTNDICTGLLCKVYFSMQIYIAYIFDSDFSAEDWCTAWMLCNEIICFFLQILARFL